MENVVVRDEQLDAPTRWRYDEETKKLHMLFISDVGATKIYSSRAIVGKNEGFFRIATLENSRRVCLLNSNYSRKLLAV